MFKKYVWLTIACVFIASCVVAVYLDNIEMQREKEMLIIENDKAAADNEESDRVWAIVQKRNKVRQKACPRVKGVPASEELQKCERDWYRARQSYYSIKCFSGGVLILEDAKVYGGISKTEDGSWEFKQDRNDRLNKEWITATGDCIIIHHRPEIEEDED